MTLSDEEARLRRLAERRVHAKFGFWIHALIYVLVNTGLIAINLVTSPRLLWSLYPALGWGVGLAAHGAAVFMTVSGVRENAIQAEMRRLRDRGL
jgi:hypothetical protein